MDKEKPIPFQADIVSVVQWLRLAIETTGAIVICTGFLVALWALMHALATRQPANFNRIRLSFARYLALALEFQLGSDILSTAFDPEIKQIAQLGAIAIIRTALNYFLTREMKEESDRDEDQMIRRDDAASLQPPQTIPVQNHEP